VKPSSSAPLALIQRSAWKGCSAKSISSMLHSPVPLRADNGLFFTLHLLSKHKTCSGESLFTAAGSPLGGAREENIREV
jgi:hypothetical protein